MPCSNADHLARLRLSERFEDSWAERCDGFDSIVARRQYDDSEALVRCHLLVLEALVSCDEHVESF
jgi:hypothetical protein